MASPTLVLPTPPPPPPSQPVRTVSGRTVQAAQPIPPIAQVEPTVDDLLREVSLSSLIASRSEY